MTKEQIKQITQLRNNGCTALEMYTWFNCAFGYRRKNVKRVERFFGPNEQIRKLDQYSRENRVKFSVWESQFNGWLCNWKLRHVYQCPLGNYIADFRLKDYLIIVELDGTQHKSNLEYDAKRTAYFNSLGYHVVRFDNTERFDKEAVKNKLFAAIQLYGKQIFTN